MKYDQIKPSKSYEKLTEEQFQKHMKSLLPENPTKYSIRKLIVCKDGFTMSVQAGWGKYSLPREYRGNYCDSYEFEDTYQKWEVGFPSDRPSEEMMKYVEDETAPTETVYGYVPSQVIIDEINSRGGLDV